MKKKLRLSIVLCVVFVFICSTFYSVWTLKGKVRLSFKLCEPPLIFSTVGRPDVMLKQAHFVSGTMSEQTLQYFLIRARIERDAAEVSWCHGVNSRSRLMEALSGKPPNPEPLTAVQTLTPTSTLDVFCYCLKWLTLIQCSSPLKYTLYLLKMCVFCHFCNFQLYNSNPNVA